MVEAAAVNPPSGDVTSIIKAEDKSPGGIRERDVRQSRENASSPGKAVERVIWAVLVVNPNQEQVSGIGHAVYVGASRGIAWRIENRHFRAILKIAAHPARF